MLCWIGVLAGIPEEWPSHSGLVCRRISTYESLIITLRLVQRSKILSQCIVVHHQIHTKVPLSSHPLWPNVCHQRSWSWSWSRSHLLVIYFYHEIDDIVYTGLPPHLRNKSLLPPQTPLIRRRISDLRYTRRIQILDLGLTAVGRENRQARAARQAFDGKTGDVFLQCSGRLGGHH